MDRATFDLAVKESALALVWSTTKGGAMPQIIVFANQKGSVGKTTCVREIGLNLSNNGSRVCLIDADPQADLTNSIVESLPLTGLCDALSGKKWTLVSINENLKLLAGSINCLRVEKNLLSELDAYSRIKELLTKNQFAEFDYILIDSPSSLGILAVNCLVAANYVIIPVRPSFLAMQGVTELIGTIVRVRKSLNPSLLLSGIVINYHEVNTTELSGIEDEIYESFGEIIFKTRLGSPAEDRFFRWYNRLNAEWWIKEEARSLTDELVERLKFLQAE